MARIFKTVRPPRPAQEVVAPSRKEHFSFASQPDTNVVVAFMAPANGVISNILLKSERSEKVDVELCIKHDGFRSNTTKTLATEVTKVDESLEVSAGDVLELTLVGAHPDYSGVYCSFSFTEV
jgi:hypothetical protein